MARTEDVGAAHSSEGQTVGAVNAAASGPQCLDEGAHARVCRRKAQAVATSSPPLARLRIKGTYVPFDLRSLREITEHLVSDVPSRWEIVVTPNLHHIQLIRENDGLIEMYRNASIVLPDGWPVARLLARATGTDVDRVPGSDLLESILNADGGGRPLVLAGGEDSDALSALAVRAGGNAWTVMTEPAPAEEVEDPDARRQLLDRIASSGSGGLVVLGFGAPKQELFATDLAKCQGSGHILCLGMSLNFSAGRHPRAPQWAQRTNLEWAHRMLTEPRRLVPRYARDARAFIPTLIENPRSRR